MTKNTKEALIVIDIQNDFCTGSLAVPHGQEIIDDVNKLMEIFDTVVLTQDFHPENHSSFYTNHPDMRAFDVIDMPYGKQVLWPSHCVQGTPGSDFHLKLKTDLANMIIRKGTNAHIDSYSAFYENDRHTPTGLHGYLKELEITHLTLVGLATDFCVAYTALDAAGLGYDVTIIESMCKPIDMNGTLVEAKHKTIEAGVKWL